MAFFLFTAEENGDFMLGGMRPQLDAEAERLLGRLRALARRPAATGTPRARAGGAEERIERALADVVRLVGAEGIGEIAPAGGATARATPVEHVVLAAVASLRARRTGAAVRLILHYFDDIDTARLTLACRQLADALDDLAARA